MGQSEGRAQFSASARLSNAPTSLLLPSVVQLPSYSPPSPSFQTFGIVALVVLSLVVAAWLLGPVPGGLRQHREVLAPVAVQGDAAAQPSPRDAHLLEGLGPGPLLEGLLSDGK
jgi:hypothetical protein